MPVLRTRLGVALVSAGALALELALMRAMALRFRHHFAQMIVSVALLGFGAAGTLLALLPRPCAAARQRRGFVFCLAFAAGVPACLLLAERVPLEARLLAWDFTSQAGWVLVLEAVLLVPFLLAAGAVCTALMDRPDRVGGHYAANLLGSAVGAAAAVTLPGVLTTGQVLLGSAAAGLAAAGLLADWRRAAQAAAWLAAAGGLAAFALGVGYEPAVWPDMTLSLLRQMPGTRMLAHSEGPLGRLDVAENAAFHYAPWLGLTWTEPLPPQAVMVRDADEVIPVFDCPRPDDWRFADYTTAAAAFRAAPGRRVLVLGAGGGVGIGLARYHRAGQVTAVEPDPQVVAAMRGVLGDRGRRIYDAPGVRLVRQDIRGFLAARPGGEKWDIILLDAGGGRGGVGESYARTVEAFEAMLRRLGPGGVLAVTCRAWSPPREGLRVFDTAAEALRRLGADPAERLAMIRSWATVTVLATPGPLDRRRAAAIEAFCEQRSFDVCRLPGLAREKANRFHVLDRPAFYEAAGALLGERREEFLEQYLFDVRAATDDRPFFDHTFRWRAWGQIRAQRGAGARGFLEMGYLLLLAALGQGAVLAAVLVLLPALLRRGRGAGRAATGAYFLLLGAGFMLLEMGFLQKLTLYLAEPAYSAAVVVAGFLLFAGAGSALSRRWRGPGRRVALCAAGAVAALGAAAAWGLDAWLGLTAALPLAVRVGVAVGTIAPLAVAMGHMFPTGLRLLPAGRADLAAWAWSVNGFASVLAAVGTPLLAMEAGFTAVTALAAGCYVLAGITALRLPGARAAGAPGR